jgi:hypothetical protein
VCEARARTGWGPRLLAGETGLSDEVCVVVVTDSALGAGKDIDDQQDRF